ncbi:UDP-glycosyltransferase 85A2 [Beta vulgaris subsp. vulgaris]|uniref:UDP-glycosyltransferase 85A2 n=1 Tax=Beta vulgaris subsp. vulgaris TaxID=3555 RepID=UPI002547409C|nr:UDP-glycosyltransferase 85A2 [Beta vulgaris subsp. vulgaris]
MDSAQEQKPHAVCIPYPAQGHINPLLKLAKLLHSQGFHITFVHTEYNYNRLLRSRGPDALAGLPTFRFEAISDGMPCTEDANATQDIPSLCISTEYRSLGPFKELINRLNESGDVPQVSCIVADAAMYFTLDAAEELGIPEVLQYTASPCGFLAYTQFPKLVELGITPFKDENFLTNGDLDVVLDWVPCMKNIQVKYMPSFIRTTNPNEIMLNRLQREIPSAKRASAILFNSFDALDHEILQALAHDFPPLFTLGPLMLLLDSIEAKEEEATTINPSLWKEDSTCIEWLDSHAPNSVVYVNFGSITVMTNDQLVEFAWGLANSNQPFLWITRLCHELAKLLYRI